MDYFLLSIQNELCFRDNLTKKASSVFISEDLSGQSFLCFMLKERHILRLNI